MAKFASQNPMRYASPLPFSPWTTYGQFAASILAGEHWVGWRVAIFDGNKYLEGVIQGYHRNVTLQEVNLLLSIPDTKNEKYGLALRLTPNARVPLFLLPRVVRGPARLTWVAQQIIKRNSHGK